MKLLFLTRFSETGEALVSSVDKLIFVGSPGVGKMVCSSFGLCSEFIDFSSNS